jgi:hypothetical protein
MDVVQLLEEIGAVPAADDAIIEAAVDLVLAAAAEETRFSPSSPTTERRRHRRVVLAGAALTGTAAAVLAVVAVVAPGGHPSSPTPPSATGGHGLHHGPRILTVSMVRLISSRSATATADSGTAVETTTTTVGSSTQGPPSTIDVTFSGQNVNYVVVGDGEGAAGVENRVVDGQLYLYIKGPDLQMHWYHDTSPNAGASVSFPDPRTLLQAVSPSAGLEIVGRERVGGVELTHLRATTPDAIGALAVPDVDKTVTSFDVWVDSSNVVRQMAVTSSWGGRILCVSAPSDPPSGSPAGVTIPPTDRVSTLPDGKAVPPGTACREAKTLGTGSTTLDVSFVDLGVPETVVAPNGAIDQHGLG